MSALRTFLTLGVGLIAGGVVGAYAMTVVYGQRSSGVEPTKLQCPPCPSCVSTTPCPVCPPVDDATGPAASATPTPGETVVADTPETLDDIPRLPGLPASASKLASAGFAREIVVCIDQARTTGLRGTLLLDLTVTATDTIGRISAAELVRADPTAADAHPCLVEAARRVHFEWRDDDGQTRLRFPVQLAEPGDSPAPPTAPSP